MADVNKVRKYTDVWTHGISREQPYLEGPLMVHWRTRYARSRTRHNQDPLRRLCPGASYNGVDLGMKPIERSTARMYFQLTDQREKDIFLGSAIRKNYESEIAGIDRRASKSLSIV